MRVIFRIFFMYLVKMCIVCYVFCFIMISSVSLYLQPDQASASDAASTTHSTNQLLVSTDASVSSSGAALEPVYFILAFVII